MAFKNLLGFFLSSLNSIMKGPSYILTKFLVEFVFTSFFLRPKCISLEEKRYVWPKTFVQHKLCSKKKSQSFFIFFMIWFEMQFIYFYVSCITIISNWGNYWDWWDIYYEKSNLRMHLKNECTTKNNTKFDI